MDSSTATSAPDAASSNKKARDDSPRPQYESQNYWDERYSKGKNGVQVGKDDPLPYHAWYFTYEELRPLLLPLILGDGEGESDEEEGEEGDQVTMEETKDSECNAEDANDCQEQDDMEEEDDMEAEAEEEDGTADSENSEEDDNEEFEEIMEVESDDDDAEEVVARDGVARGGAISLIEVGCGDVPLATDLAAEFRVWEKNTGSASGNILERVVCTDFSKTVVDLLEEQRRNGKVIAGTNTKLDFAVADARNLPYPNDSFHLVLEKGTLDAMLSDEKDGIENCIKIVTECARVLAVGGYILLVSHLNAHTPRGLAWLDDVLVPGLRKGGGDATWVIETHGNDENPNKQEGPPSGSPGPAVYIIQKKPPHPGGKPDQPPPIPLKFFSY